MRTKILAWGLAAGLSFSGLSRAYADDVAATLELAVLHSQGLQRIALPIAKGDRTYQQLWDQKFAAIFDYCDIDRNGTLNQAEAARLPAAAALREATYSGFAPVIKSAPKWEDLGATEEGSITREQLAAYYRSHDVGPPMIGFGVAPFTNDLTAALLARLDADQDGMVSRDEWSKAEAVLDQLDQNDDQMIGAGELVAGVFYPGTSASYLLQVASEDRPALAEAMYAFPVSRLPQQPGNTAWSQRLQSQAGFPKSLREASPDQLWNVQLFVDDQTQSIVVEGVGEKGPQTELPCVKLGDTWLTVRSDPGQMAERLEGLRISSLEQFAESDEDLDGVLSQAEWSASGKGFGSAMVAMMDRDGDQQLTKAELEGWLTLQGEIASGLVMVTIVDCGNGVLELLDTDRNGALSRRELRQAVARLEAVGCVQGDTVDLKRLPRQLLFTISIGPPDSVLGKIQRRGPDWFLSMDRNQDGDVSEAEFVGGAEAFQSLDANGDKLITFEEVENLKVD
ncbi:hypothetical protein AB1L30_06210 [Bremerella sp. JC817]|uniref:hypothetical protein n=1 Tax=Bremerella sp. JC817 TaxID=3231756 RepID=UPI00345ACB7D